MLTITDIGRANKGSMVERMERRPMIRLKERIGGKSPGLDVRGELLQWEPPGVPTPLYPTAEGMPTPAESRRGRYASPGRNPSSSSNIVRS